MTQSPMVWLVGSGNMSIEYAKVLRALNVNFLVIGRGAISAKHFQESTGIPVFIGGVQNALEQLPLPKAAIVATGISDLANTSLALLEVPQLRLLVEKPAALFHEELISIHRKATSLNSNVFVAYNRRFFASVAELRKRLSAEGGATSAVAEISEWSHIIEKLHKSDLELQRWLIANTSHVLDLMFSIIGAPQDSKLSSYVSGRLPWHHSGAVFTGAGISSHGIPFSYHGNWHAAGRWGLEVTTRENKYILRPLEMLQRIHIGEVNPSSVQIDSALDLKYKPGLYLQTECFLNWKLDQLCTLNEHLSHFHIYSSVAGYDT